MEENNKALSSETVEEAKLQTLRHKKKIQIISLIAFAAVVILGTILAIPLIKTLSSDNGMEHMKEILEKYDGILGVLIFVSVQALQVVLAVIPPIQVVGGLLFGWLWGGVLSFVGTFLGTALIFVIVSKFGRPVVEAFISEKHMKKFAFLENEKKLTVILIILYLIPGIPKDVISYIVPLTPISKKDFFCYVMPCRIPAIILSTVMGGNLGNGHFVVALVVVGIFLILGIIGLLFKDVILNKIRSHKSDK